MHEDFNTQKPSQVLTLSVHYGTAYIRHENGSNGNFFLISALCITLTFKGQTLIWNQMKFEVWFF